MGISCNRKKVVRLMKLHKIQSKKKQKFIKTTDSNHKPKVHQNTLNRQFNDASRPNQKWVADITYLRTISNFVYLAIILDLYSRKIVGWSVSNFIDIDLCLKALFDASNREQNLRAVLHHSDRGSQYCNIQYQNALSLFGIQFSMSRRGNCWDKTARVKVSLLPLNGRWIPRALIL